MKAGDFFGALSIAVIVMFLGFLFVKVIPDTKAEQKATIQCETLGGIYHEDRCIEVAGTIQLPKEES